MEQPCAPTPARVVTPDCCRRSAGNLSPSPTDAIFRWKHQVAYRDAAVETRRWRRMQIPCTQWRVKEHHLCSQTLPKLYSFFVWSFPVVAKHCAASFTLDQLLKCDRLDKYGRLWDLFGVTAEVLSGTLSASDQ